MYLPDWIYRLLPLIYVLAGILVGTKMESSLATVSAVLLVAAGLLIWKMRADHRRASAGPKPAAPGARRSR